MPAGARAAKPEPGQLAPLVIGQRRGAGIMEILRRQWPALRQRAPALLHSWWFRIGAAIGILALLLAIGAAFFIDEPLRKQTEARMNAALRGYTVSIGRLDFHPIGFSLDLEQVEIRQNAKPDPPVALIPNLTAGVEWKALLRGRVVAHFAFDDPVLDINLTNFEEERRDDTKLHQRGWQDALQAIYPLEINEFSVRNGKLTYTDRGRYRPLEIRNFDFLAQNIRNVRSDEGEYPSPVRLSAEVFEKGRVELKGHADFLAKPHVAFNAKLDLQKIDLGYFRPITERYYFDVRRGVFSTSGTIEYAAKKKIIDVPEIRIDSLVADYVHAKRDTGPTEELSKKTDKVVKKTSNDPEFEVRLDRMRVAGGELGMINRASKPQYRLFLTDLRMNIDNLSNQSENGVATARVEGLFMGSGKARLMARMRPQEKSANFDLNLVIEEVDMQTMNQLFLASGNFDVRAGWFSLYSEIAVRKGAVDGYVKPLFRDVDVYDSKQDRKKGIFQKMYEGILGGLSWLLENRRREEVATTTRISGKLSNPETSTWEIIVGLVQNAFFRSILPGLEQDIESGRRGGRAEKEKKNQP